MRPFTFNMTPRIRMGAGLLDELGGIALRCGVLSGMLVNNPREVTQAEALAICGAAL